MSVGFRPRTEMVEAEKLPNGAIKVNDFQQILGDENIYVIGDSSAIKHSVTGNHAHVALATNAVKTGVVACIAHCRIKYTIPRCCRNKRY
nr:FAD-dependent oxidoreductase [Mycoplasmopsis bovis]